MKKLLLTLALILLTFPVFAQVTPNSIVTAQTPTNGFTQFTNSTSVATFQTVFTAGANGSKLTGLFISNSDTATHVVTCGRFNATVEYESWSVTTVAAVSGSYNNAAMLSTWIGLPIDGQGNPFMYLVAGDSIQCRYATVVTSPLLLNVTAIAANF